MAAFSNRSLAGLAFVLGVSFLLTACASVSLVDDHTPIPAPEDTVEVLGGMPAPSKTNDGCSFLNREAPNTTVTYTHEQKGIGFDIPYNDHWGYTESLLPAFAEYEEGDMSPLGYVLFGPPTSGSLEGFGDGCDLIQSYELTFLPARTAESAKRTIEGRGTDIVPNAKVRTINGLTVVQYMDVGLCNYPTMEVVGKVYNYSFTTTCGGNTEEEWIMLENTVKSIKLTK